jgi:opacity protein-like surface antigen
MRTTLLLTLFLLPLTARAQSVTEGFFLGGHVGGAGLAAQFDDGDTELDLDAQGGTLNLRAGYGFSRAFTLFLETGGGELEAEFDVPILPDLEFDTGSYYLDLGGEFSFGDARAQWVPFVSAALNAVRFSNDEDGDEELALSGGGLSLGGGVGYFATPQLSIRLAVATSFGQLNEITVGRTDRDLDDTTYSFSRLQIGLGYRFR